jgi:hypothetical protein
MSDAATDGNAPGDARHCRLRVTAGLSNVSIQAGEDMDRFLQAKFRGEVPRVDVDGSEITIRSQCSGLDALRTLFDRRRKPQGEITLNASVVWDLGMRGGVSNVSADLRDVRLDAIDIAGGIDRVEIDLPHPSGPVHLRIAGGVSRLTFHRPAGVPVALQARGGVTGLRVDGERFRPVGGVLNWESPGFNPDAAHFALDVHGGVSGLTIDTR